jgi:trimethylamine--corrinoid protein Co-methyltransferase
VKAFFKGIEVNDETLALDDIVKVGANGSYLGTKHTRKHHKETWYPDLFERGIYKDWERKGSKPLAERAAERVQEILANHQPEPLAEEIKARLSQIVNNGTTNGNYG